MNESEAPKRIYGWRDSQMSIARHYGGLKYMGHDYYIAHDEECEPLVRNDILKVEKKQKKAKLKAEKTVAESAQIYLYD